ncbi:hypothetical protein BASA50_001122 [Batrachochytrium salamandrivorans]|uniref:Uncharacterized protein n=1 Tax=Batrachochytrium salamandrivorans TaxID=1357716 RepID=A0ABQ8ES06_9FUNG|nr:hypothetical protein BASA50_001122 [Batrachochytrium salamandrivorans]
MKLISFVAISFLAITVSAYPGLGTPPQSPRRFDQGEIQAELDGLKMNYEQKQMTFYPMDIEIKNEKQKVMGVWDDMELIIAKLEDTGISSDETSELWKEYRAAEVKWDELKLKYDKKHQSYAKIRKVRDSAKAELYLLMENQKLIADRNIEYNVETGPSPGSFYDIGLLKTQNDEILRKIEDLLEKQKGIMAAMAAMGGSERDSMAQSDELKDGIRFLQAQHKVAKKILRKYNQRRSIGAQVRGFINSRLPNAQIE